MCKLGFHIFKKTDQVDKVAVFDKPNSWEYMRKYTCNCGKEEYRQMKK